jgi:hypothetical protein
MKQLQVAQIKVQENELLLKKSLEEFEDTKIKHSIAIGKSILEKSDILDNDFIRKSIMGITNMEELQSFYIAKGSNGRSGFFRYLVFVNIFNEKFIVLDDRYLTVEDIEKLNYHTILSYDFLEEGLKNFNITLQEAGINDKKDINIIDIFDNDIKEFLSTIASEYISIIH